MNDKISEVIRLNRLARTAIERSAEDITKFNESTGEAITLLEKALALSPNDLNTLTNYGAVLCDMGREGDAVTHLRKAVSLNSQNAHTYFNLGVALHSVGTHEEAIRQLRMADRLLVSPETWQAYFDPMGL